MPYECPHNEHPPRCRSTNARIAGEVAVLFYPPHGKRSGWARASLGAGGSICETRRTEAAQLGTALGGCGSRSSRRRLEARTLYSLGLSCARLCSAPPAPQVRVLERAAALGRIRSARQTLGACQAPAAAAAGPGIRPDALP